MSPESNTFVQMPEVPRLTRCSVREYYERNASQTSYQVGDQVQVDELIATPGRQYRCQHTS